MKRNLLFLLVGLFFLLMEEGCVNKPEEYRQVAADPETLRQAESQLTEVIAQDIFSPPVASRIYAYASLAAYEAYLPAAPEYRTMAGQLAGLKVGPLPQVGQDYCFALASVRAYLILGRALTLSDDRFDDFEKMFYKQFKVDGVPDDVFQRSMAYGEAVGKHILAYAVRDNYKQIRGFRYTVEDLKGIWVPTPPGYMDAIEPLWRTLRPFGLDSASQFLCPIPPPYSEKPDSAFYKEMAQVHDFQRNLTIDQKQIAYFWDDNPFKLDTVTHVNRSPAGHWMSIVGFATRKANADFAQTLEAYTLTSLAIFDGFLACWDEKYHSLRIRPETAINAIMDKEWRPLVETPPFPEYPSEQSTISAASSSVLTNLFGDHFAFADSSKLTYGLPVRSFASFEAAAQEAATSRFYAGVHFQSSIAAGLTQGRKVSQWLLATVHTRKVQPVQPLPSASKSKAKALVAPAL